MNELKWPEVRQFLATSVFPNREAARLVVAAIDECYRYGVKITHLKLANMVLHVGGLPSKG